MRDRTHIFNQYSRCPSQIRAFNSMPPTTVARIVVPPHIRVSTAASRRTRVRTSLPRVEMNTPPNSYITIICPWAATHPLRLFSQNIRILHAVFSAETYFTDSEAEVPSTKFLSSPIYPDPSSLPKSPSPPLQRVIFSEVRPRYRVKCRATNVCIHSVDTLVRYFDSP